MKISKQSKVIIIIFILWISHIDSEKKPGFLDKLKGKVKTSFGKAKTFFGMTLDNSKELVKEMKEKFNKVNETLSKSKIYHFVMGAIESFLRGSKNSIGDCLFCVVDAFRLYNTLVDNRAKAEKKSLENQKKAEDEDEEIKSLLTENEENIDDLQLKSVTISGENTSIIDDEEDHIFPDDSKDIDALKLPEGEKRLKTMIK